MISRQNSEIVPEVFQLWDVLGKLEENDQKAFKMYLSVAGSHNNFSPVPWAWLQKADHMDVGYKLVQKYNEQSMDVTIRILRRMEHNALADELEERSKKRKAQQSQLAQKLLDKSQATDVEQQSRTEREPPTSKEPKKEPKEKAWLSDPNIELTDLMTQAPEDILELKPKLQSHLEDTFCQALDGIRGQGDQQPLDDIYTNLVIVSSGDTFIDRQHEVRDTEDHIGMEFRGEDLIEPCDIFKKHTEKYNPLRTVLTIGIAGIGKTVLVHKFVLDWAQKNKNGDLQLVFPFTFRELNLKKGKRFCLAELIRFFIWDKFSVKELNNIFVKMQASENRCYEKSDYKVLFVLDGLDESRLRLDINADQSLPSDYDVKKPKTVDTLVSDLISGMLLPCARVWITTRPAAVNKIQGKLIGRMLEVRGFNDKAKVKFFKKYFKDEEHHQSIITHLKASRSLFIMCYIPVFCHITATVLENLLHAGKKDDLPTTLTEMYNEFLLYQITKTEERNKKKSIQYMKSLAKLAFDQVKRDRIVFYERDLNASGIHISKASDYCGMFTVVFKEIQRQKSVKDKGKMFTFVHLTVQEYLAALHVVISSINKKINVLSNCVIPCLCHKNTLSEIHKNALGKALSASDGRLDLFLRFLLGLSLKSNQERLQGLLNGTNACPETIQNTIRLIRQRIEVSPTEKNTNLFHCLKELKDDSLLQQIQKYLLRGRLNTNKLPHSLWCALVFILLTSEETRNEFDLRKYSASEEALLWLLPVVKASKTSLLNDCNLSVKSCESLALVLSSPSSYLRHLDLSDNELSDDGLKHLCGGLESEHCVLETLRMSGCLITTDGCVALADAMHSNPSHLRELDLSYNHPGEAGKTLLIAMQKDPRLKLQTLNLEGCGEDRLRRGLKKYTCDLQLDKTTAHRNLKLSRDLLKVTVTQEQQPYSTESDRFDYWLQVLCGDGLTGRCYWEVQWDGRVYIGVTYAGIRRIGVGTDGCLGSNDDSWTLVCDDDGTCSVRHRDHEKRTYTRRLPSKSVAVFLDYPAGTLTFYELPTNKEIYTFACRFKESLFPAFGFGFGNELGKYGSYISLRSWEESFSTSF